MIDVLLTLGIAAIAVGFGFCVYIAKKPRASQMTYRAPDFHWVNVEDIRILTHHADFSLRVKVLTELQELSSEGIRFAKFEGKWQAIAIRRGKLITREHKARVSTMIDVLDYLTSKSLVGSQNQRSTPNQIVHGIDSDGCRPPRFAEYLLYFLPKTYRDGFMGDVEEEYRLLYHRFGIRHAQLWYWWQVVASFRPLITRWLSWGLIGWVANLVRRLIP